MTVYDYIGAIRVWTLDNIYFFLDGHVRNIAMPKGAPKDEVGKTAFFVFWRLQVS